MHSSFPNAIRCFKIIPRTSLVNGKLKLPRNFTTKCGDGMSNPVFLKPPDGTEWKIYWTNHDGEMWFQEGWKEFATYYSLEHGHLLLFEYVGISHFDVHIFDISALEIDYPFHFSHDSPEKISDDYGDGKEILVQTSDDSIEILDEKCHDGMDSFVQITDDSKKILDEQRSKKAGVKYKVSSPQPGKKMKNSTITKAGPGPNEVNLYQHDQTRSTTFQEPKFMKQKLDGEKGKSIFHTECPKVEQLTSTALHKATTFKSIHPSLMLVMNPSFINEGYLDIPSHFSEQYLKKTHAVVYLEVMDGRSWPVIFSAPRITVGWQQFASENNLNVEDVCVFELIWKTQSPAFKVSIFRSASSPISHGVHPSTKLRGGSSSERTSRLDNHLKLKLLKGEGLKEASKFTSENPFFMATLRLQGNTTRCPCVPSNFVRKYFVDMNQEWLTIQFRKKLWLVTFLLTNTSGTLSAGWPAFSRENKLQEGDVCIFELIDKVTLHVHVFRGRTEVMH